MQIKAESQLQSKIFRLKDEFIRKIKRRSAVIGVVGLGYVGLPFAVEKAKVGFQVIGVDRNSVRTRLVNQGESYIDDIQSTELKQLVDEGRLRASTQMEEVQKMDAIVICVPTPLTKNLTPDLQYVEKVTVEIAKYLQPGQLICLESTTYPGTTEEVMLPILENSGLRADQDFFLAYSPERVDPGNQRYTTKNTNKVVGGIGPHSLEAAASLYGETVETIVPVSNTKTAELVKVYENIFRAVNIALVNELTMLCDRMEMNVWEVLDAAFTKPFGIMPFYPGPGVGGHCIPIDPHYLEWKAREYQFQTHFIALAGEINRSMPEFVRNKTIRVLNRLGIASRNAKVLVLGVTYKKDIRDVRESPAMEIIRLLQQDVIRVTYHDPYVSEITDLNLYSQPLTEQVIKDHDLVLIVTDHSSFHYSWIVDHANHVLDTRNATRFIQKGKEKITLL